MLLTVASCPDSTEAVCVIAGYVHVDIDSGFCCFHRNVSMPTGFDACMNYTVITYRENAHTVCVCVVENIFLGYFTAVSASPEVFTRGFEYVVSS